MIGKLKGIVDSIEEGHAIIDVGGVGYLVFASANSLRTFPAVGEAVTLLIDTHVREDHIHLYGFTGAEEKEWFGILTTVKGVGTKMALAILSSLVPHQIKTALAAQDKAAFTSVSGVGPRLAERLLTELKNKADKVITSDAVPLIAVAEGSQNLEGYTQDAISALTNLGYNRSLAYGAVQRAVANNPAIKLEELIREGLKELASA
jgi:Holliday junction DNA helicase RuvA